MQYSPKLKKAMEEIKDILSKHDIGGIVILHTISTPGNSEKTEGFAEFLNKLDPSYSCVKVNGDYIRFRSKLADYGGDKSAWQKKTSDSLNMMQTFVEVGQYIITPLMELTKRLEKELNAESDGGNFSSHTTQNN